MFQAAAASTKINQMNRTAGRPDTGKEFGPRVARNHRDCSGLFPCPARLARGGGNIRDCESERKERERSKIRTGSAHGYWVTEW